MSLFMDFLWSTNFFFLSHLTQQQLSLNYYFFHGWSRLIFMQTAVEPWPTLWWWWCSEFTHAHANIHTFRKVCDMGRTLAGLLSIGCRTGARLCVARGPAKWSMCLYSTCESTKVWQVQPGSLQQLQYWQNCRNYRCEWPKCFSSMQVKNSFWCQVKYKLASKLQTTMKLYFHLLCPFLLLQNMQEYSIT